jgi:general secretion pathway protein N
MPRPLAAAVPMQRPPWGWALAGAGVALAAGLAFFAPARWAAAAVAHASGGRVLFEGARGTVWNGSAHLVLSGGQGSRDGVSLPSPLQWRLRPTMGGLQLALTSFCCTPQPLVVSVHPRWGGAAVSVANSAASQWPAAVLSGLGTPWNTLQLEGQLQLSTQDLSLAWNSGRVQVSGRAQLAALRLASRVTTVRPMGSYQLQLDGGATPRLTLDTAEGPLRLAGSGQWVGSRLRFSGEASAEPEREAALANLLNIIGRRRGARSIITIG